MIAHSCTQTGLSETFREIFNFEGSEFYTVDLPGIEGLEFGDLMIRVSDAVPIGIMRDGKIRINPPADSRLLDSDRVVVFAEENDSAKLEPVDQEYVPTEQTIQPVNTENATNTVIIGHNETLSIILYELPKNVSYVYLADQRINEEEKDEIELVASNRNLQLEYFRGNTHSEKTLLQLAQMAEHIVILSDHDKDPEEADMEAIFLLLNLRDLRSRFGFDFNITVEMQKEHNQKLVGKGDHTDFLVASSMSSLILAQLAESPELIDVFKEILSNEGNELYLKSVKQMNLIGSYSVRDLRRIMLNEGYILIGHLDADKYSRFNLPLNEAILLSEADNLIVLGQN